MTSPQRNLVQSVRSASGAPAAVAWAAALALAFFVITGLSESLVIRALRPTALELDWISDAMLSTALGVTVYLWLHLRATRVALTEHERAQLVLHAQLSLAEAMQRRLLPAVPDPADGLEWAATLVPAGRIGGDFFDFVHSAPGVRLMLIADVSGKGIAAAMALTLLRATFRRLAQETDGPAQLASRLSTALQDEWHGSPYVTCLIARIDVAAWALTYTNAGHPRGILLRGLQDRPLAEGGPPLGLLPQASFVEEQVELKANDTCIFVTDGVSEALDDVVRPWGTTIVEAIRSIEQKSAASVCQTILSVAQNGHGPAGIEDWSDDRTVVVLRVAGSFPASETESKCHPDNERWEYLED